MLTVDALTMSLIAGAVLPLVTALLTKCAASPAVKSVVNVILSIATGSVAVLVNANGKGVPWQSLVLAGYAAYAASGTAHSHLWSPTGVTGAVAAIAPGVGIGTPTDHGAHSAP